ncbi:MAG: hypothetical protein ACXWLH_02715 [Candidatus Saccharimonadales bacterium]
MLGTPLAMAVVAIVIIVIVASSGGSNSKASASQPSGSGISLSQNDKNQVKNDLSITLIPTEAQCHDDSKFLWRSLAPVDSSNPTDRHDSESVSTPFTMADQNGLFDQLKAENCGNPTELDMNIRALHDFSVGGVNIGQNNPWMDEFLQRVSDAKTLKAAFLTQPGGDNTPIFVSADFQRYAGLTNALLAAFQRIGIQPLPSVSNWHQDPSKLASNELPRTVLNTVQENLPALVLAYTLKGQQCPLVQFGFNVQDKRFEGFQPPNCAPPAAPPTSPPPPGHHPPTTVPGCHCRTTTTTTPCVCTTTSTVPPCVNNTSGKCTPPHTVPPPPTTAPPAHPTTTTTNPSDSGWGAPPDRTPPPPPSTVPAVPVPITTPPTIVPVIPAP